MRIAVLVTVHNRVGITVRGLSRFAELVSGIYDDFDFRFFLVDDGSTDGTGEKVRQLPLNITVVRGSGSLFWSRGMVAAYTAARESGEEFDAYLLYNDDVYLGWGFLDFLPTFRALSGSSILVGAFQEPSTGEVSYSGFRSTGKFRPMALSRPSLTQKLVPVDTFNGNLVAIPASVFEALGGFDPKFWHAYGDIDFGLRARAMGIPAYVYGYPIGNCERNIDLLARVRESDFLTRWRLLTTIHGIGQYLHFVRRHGVPALLPAYAGRELVHRLGLLFGRRRR